MSTRFLQQFISEQTLLETDRRKAKQLGSDSSTTTNLHYFESFRNTEKF